MTPSLFILCLTLWCQVCIARSQQFHHAPKLTSTIISNLPHDERAFTQGFLYSEGVFYESTGLYSSSSFRKVRVADGVVLEIKPLPRSDFGEGLALHKDSFYQLTWREKKIYSYSKNMTLQRTFTNPLREGWGLTSNGTQLFLSDGSSTISILNDNLEVLSQIQVTKNGAPVPRLNELEFIDGNIWANIWYSDEIVIIDPQTGQVKFFLELSHLPRGSDVLNGIAYDPDTKRIWVTGKLWPQIFQIQVEGIN
eukprot:TRINITY_DN4119_c0_g1_i1.p1 TRINITY_DN4119_c0_g1~~TRINITY_DN4119_c0_g1_i1.p1  ORF type:complete len:252 (+),score=25.17 TRINITY_DN4119_c0_g1_i1:68-823(+)